LEARAWERTGKVVISGITPGTTGTMMDKRKVIVRRVDGIIIKGYVNPGSEPVRPEDGEITVTSLTEEIIKVPKHELKALFFVRKFSGDKDYAEIKFFESQPKIDGLWVRVVFFDDEVIEGIVTNSMKFLTEDGFYLKPPDPNSNNRLMYVVKSALKDFSVLGVQYSKGNIADYYERFLSSKNPEVNSSS
jgi:Family of unknown function (DUF6982)